MLWVYISQSLYFFQVLEGLKKVTVISPEDVSFAEARRDALIAIAKYVSHCCLCLIFNLSVEVSPFCWELGAWVLKSLTHILTAYPLLSLFLIQGITTHLTMDFSSDSAVRFLSVNWLPRVSFSVCFSHGLQFNELYWGGRIYVLPQS